MAKTKTVSLKQEEEEAVKTELMPEEVKGPNLPEDSICHHADGLSKIVKSHYLLNPDAYSKPSDYNQLMRKIENLKSDILKFIK